MGFIVFIDHASEVISTKKTAADQAGSPTENEFAYAYGVSLILFGVSVIFSEFSGFAYAAFYLRYYRYTYVRCLPQFALDLSADAYSDPKTRCNQLDSSRLKSRDVRVHSVHEPSFLRHCNGNGCANGHRFPSRSCNDLTGTRRANSMFWIPTGDDRC
jgi:hypothetical protein